MWLLTKAWQSSHLQVLHPKRFVTFFRLQLMPRLPSHRTAVIPLGPVGTGRVRLCQPHVAVHHVSRESSFLWDTLCHLIFLNRVQMCFFFVCLFSLAASYRGSSQTTLLLTCVTKDTRTWRLKDIIKGTLSKQRILGERSKKNVISVPEGCWFFVCFPKLNKNEELFFLEQSKIPYKIKSIKTWIKTFIMGM